MPVDPQKPRKVLVVHGVQTGDNASLTQDQLIQQLIESRISEEMLKFDCELYKYEDLNDETLGKYEQLMNLLVANPVGKMVADTVLDLAGDVVISLVPGGTAEMIRAGLREKILKIYEEGHPCYIVAHSLGSIYSFDVVNALIDEGRFDHKFRRTWPVQGLLTIGSPIGLNMFQKTGRDRIAHLGTGGKRFRWLNIWDPNDPVVSGNIFGQSLAGNKVAEQFLSEEAPQGWAVRDIRTDSGKEWLMAHTAYWECSVVGDKLVEMIAS